MPVNLVKLEILVSLGLELRWVWVELGLVLFNFHWVGSKFEEYVFGLEFEPSLTHVYVPKYELLDNWDFYWVGFELNWGYLCLISTGLYPILKNLSLGTWIWRLNHSCVRLVVTYFSKFDWHWNFCEFEDLGSSSWALNTQNWVENMWICFRFR